MRKRLTTQLKSQLSYYKDLKRRFEKEIKNQEISFENRHYIKLLSKLSFIDARIEHTKNKLKILRSQDRFARRIIVNIKSKVKLVSLDFQIILWVDAKNTKDLLGKRVGEIIELYNSNFKIAAIY